MSAHPDPLQSLSDRARPPRTAIFDSFFQGGFECSTHREADGRRLDLTHATGHDRLAALDYAMLFGVGIRTVRDGVRWHLIEKPTGRRDWSSLTPMLASAEATGVQVVWDLLHFGWPDHLDVWSPDFPARFADFTAEAVEVIRAGSSRRPLVVTPVNEISFLSWAGGEHAIFNPMARGQGDALKRQLVRCAIAAVKAAWSVDPTIRVTHTDPVINVVPRPGEPETAALAEERTEAQFQAWDMIAGRREPELGGRPEYLDVLGLNYYCHNQWTVEGPPIDWRGSDPSYVAPAALFARAHARYGRPMYISETGIEAELRPEWFAHVCDEVAKARAAGVPIHGVCLYPVMNHPGWVDDRHCPNGLVDYDPLTLRRWLDEPLLVELLRQRQRFGALGLA